MLPLEEDEKITVMLLIITRRVPRRSIRLHGHQHGHGQENPAVDFSNPRKAGIIAVTLDESDYYLIGAAITDGQHDVMLFSDAGKSRAL